MAEETKEKEGSVWDEFTGKYELSKTLRFELRPVGETQNMLEENDVFEKDRVRKEKYENIKPWFDRMHREFAKEALTEITLSGLEKYSQTLSDLTKDPKNKKLKENLQKEEGRLRVEVVKAFDNKAKEWSEKLYPELDLKTSIGLFFEESVFALLKKRYGTEKDSFVVDENGQEISIFDDWKGFTGYFDKFFETRKNFYKNDGTSTALATRMIDQNLRRFCSNLSDFEVIKKKIDFSEVEEKFSTKCEDFFKIEFYSRCVLQEGIDFYNKILGGETKENGEKLKGINELVNKYRQDHKDEKPHFLKKLDKQILSEKEKLLRGIPDDNALLDELKDFYETAEEKIPLLKRLITDFIKNEKEFELEKIYISKEALNTISHKWVTNVEVFEKIIYDTLKQHKAEYNILHLAKDSKLEETEDGVSFPNFIKIEHLKKALNSSTIEWKLRYYKNETDEETKNKGIFTGKETGWNQFLAIFNFEFSSLFHEEKTDEITKEIQYFGYDIYKTPFKKLLEDENFTIDTNTKAVVKDFADNTKWIYQMGKYFAVEKKRAWLENYELCDRFYGDPDNGYLRYYENAYDKLVKKYDSLRNYLTKKTYGVERWKLNFDHSKLLQGFTESKTEKSDNGTQYGSYLLRKKDENGDAQYFLGISKNAHLISSFEQGDSSGSCGYERMNYYQVKTNSIYGTSYSGNYQEDKANLPQEEVVKKIKQALKSYALKIPRLNTLITKNYLTIKDIQKDIDLVVSESGKIFAYKTITNNQLSAAFNCRQKFYLFKIYSKDFSQKKKQGSQENLHTKYFKGLMTEQQSSFDIGTGELFFRPKTSVKNLGFRRNKEGNVLRYMNKAGSLENVPQHRRYSEDKIFLHLSLVLNSGKEAPDNKWFAYNYNKQLNNFLAGNPDVNVIGVDRGEKHLAYYSVINQKQEILESRSLNVIGGRNYQEVLKNREALRKSERQSWNDVESIKDLKKGYVSQVVRVLADLIIRHNAIIVLEDLNMRFKQVRGGIERSVYQQLEKALIDKLNFLVEKREINPSKAGHLLKAYQLTAPFTTFKEMGKQTGILFYTQAEYTSTTDPLTGFRKNIYISNSSSQEKIKLAIKKFEKIGWDDKRESYFFTYNPINFTEDKYKEKTFSKEWTVYADVLRLKRERNNLGQWKTEPLNPNEKLREIFFTWGFENPTAEDMKEEILRKIEDKEIIGNKKIGGKERSFAHAFIFMFNQILNIRNSSSEDGVDFIASPVFPNVTTGNTYGSANLGEFEKMVIGNKNQAKEEILKEFNGDANGAYNIARKGIMILERIKKNPEKPELYIFKNQWDEFVTKEVK